MNQDRLKGDRFIPLTTRISKLGKLKNFAQSITILNQPIGCVRFNFKGKVPKQELC